MQLENQNSQLGPEPSFSLGGDDVVPWGPAVQLFLRPTPFMFRVHFFLLSSHNRIPLLHHTAHSMLRLISAVWSSVTVLANLPRCSPLFLPLTETVFIVAFWYGMFALHRDFIIPLLRRL